MVVVSLGSCRMMMINKLAVMYLFIVYLYTCTTCFEVHEYFEVHIFLES